MSEKLLCKNCQYFFLTPLDYYPRCDHPEAYHSLVDGKPGVTCKWYRGTNDNICGPEGKWYEAKGTIMDEKMVEPEDFVPVCNHPELIPTSWNQPRLAPAKMNCCACGQNATCPICGWGWGAYPCDCNRKRRDHDY